MAQRTRTRTTRTAARVARVVVDGASTEGASALTTVVRVVARPRPLASAAGVAATYEPFSP
jgi:hypothetical protein